MKALKIILGILVIIGAIALLSLPQIYAAVFYQYLFAIVVGVIGIVSIIDYCVNRKKRKFTGVQVALGSAVVVTAIVDIIFMLFNITIPGFTEAWTTIQAVLLMCYVIFMGIMSIVNAFSIRSAASGTKAASIILGILAVIAAVIGLCNLGFVISLMGLFTSISILVFGILLLTAGITGQSAKE